MDGVQKVRPTLWSASFFLIVRFIVRQGRALFTFAEFVEIS
jgi:hypothetical protein